VYMCVKKGEVKRERDRDGDMNTGRGACTERRETDKGQTEKAHAMRGHKGVRRYRAPCGTFTSHTGCLYSRMSTLILLSLRTCCATARIITRAHLEEIRLF